jgi:hypothetical protein
VQESIAQHVFTGCQVRHNFGHMRGTVSQEQVQSGPRVASLVNVAAHGVTTPGFSLFPGDDYVVSVERIGNCSDGRGFPAAVNSFEDDEPSALCHDSGNASDVKWRRSMDTCARPLVRGIP